MSRNLLYRNKTNLIQDYDLPYSEYAKKYNHINLIH